jgi:quercetin dioxygenase-like cupin family protein
MRYERDIKHDAELDAYFGKSRALSESELEEFVFRFDSLPASNMAFIDAALPGHRRTLMGALGAGAADEDLHSTVDRAQNYHIDYIRAQPGNGAALHSHDTEETFICLTGTWRILLGDRGEYEVELNYLDGIVCPPGVMRAFQNTCNSEALLLSILGGQNPGHVVWAESLRDKLRAGE